MTALTGRPDPPVREQRLGRTQPKPLRSSLANQKEGIHRTRKGKRKRSRIYLSVKNRKRTAAIARENCDGGFHLGLLVSGFIQHLGQCFWSKVIIIRVWKNTNALGPRLC